MRHEQNLFQHSRPVDESAVEWLALQSVPMANLGASPEPTYGANAAPDIPAAVGVMIAVSYFALIGALFVSTAGSASSIFSIVIAALFVAIFFTVPRIFLAVEPASGRRPVLADFMERGINTYTGHSSGSAALVQMLVVPVFLTFAVLAIGLIIKLS